MKPLADYRILALGAGLLALVGCAEPSPQASLTPAAPTLNAQQLVGITPAVLSTQFGPPLLRRVDGTAQVWVYHSAVCGLDVFLYPDSTGTPRVAAVLPDASDGPGCLQSFSGGTTDASLQLPTRS